jgi:DNA polymerase
MFVGPFTVVDYSSIEARVLAWVAGERWAVEAFEAGRDIYTETAQRMGGLTRQQGKVAVLALGYGGGVQSLRGMGAEGTDEELDQMKEQWRNANPSIRRLWKSFEYQFLDGGKGVSSFVTVDATGPNREVVLPSGRSMVYRNVKREKDTREGAQFAGGGSWTHIRFDNPARGFRDHTYGGRLVENVVQAISRDILAQALVNLEDAGYRTVGHVHDEVIVEGTHDLEIVSKLMCDIEWADGLPLAAEGFHCQRYRKA